MKRTLLASAAAVALVLGVPSANAEHIHKSQNEPAVATQKDHPGSSRQGESSAASSHGGQHAGDAHRSPSTTGAAPHEEDNAATGGSNRSSADKDANPSRGAAQHQSMDKKGAASDHQNQASQTHQKEDKAQSADKGGNHERSAHERSSNERRERNAQERSQGRNAREDHARDHEATTNGRGGAEDRESVRGTTRHENGNAEEARGAASLKGEQRTRVTQRFAARIDRMNVRSVSRDRISVSLRVGATIPRSIHLYPVPEDVIAIYPRFRGDRFVLVEDEIVVIEPGTRHVVAVLPRGGSRYSSRETTGRAASGEHLRLSSRERTEIRTVIMRNPSCHYEAKLDFTFGIPLPRSAQVCEFPQTVLSEYPDVRQYRYVVKGDSIAVVDPDDYRIVDVIR